METNWFCIRMKIKVLDSVGRNVWEFPLSLCSNNFVKRMEEELQHHFVWLWGIKDRLSPPLGGSPASNISIRDWDRNTYILTTQPSLPPVPQEDLCIGASTVTMAINPCVSRQGSNIRYYLPLPLPPSLPTPSVDMSSCWRKGGNSSLGRANIRI